MPRVIRLKNPDSTEDVKMKRASSCTPPPLTETINSFHCFSWQLPMFLEKIGFAAISCLGDNLYDPLPSCSVFKDGNKFTPKKLAGSCV